MKEFKKIIKFTMLFTLLYIISGCANSDFESYSAEPDSMNCFRKKLKGSKAQISLAIEGEENRFYIPLIYLSYKVRSPYSVKFVLSTDSLLYDSVLITNAILKNKAGKTFSLMEENRTISLNFSYNKYSGYALKEAFEADFSLPRKINIDYKKNSNLTIAVDFSLISKSNEERYNVETYFYAIHEKWSGSILSTITN